MSDIIKTSSMHSFECEFKTFSQNNRLSAKNKLSTDEQRIINKWLEEYVNNLSDNIIDDIIYKNGGHDKVLKNIHHDYYCNIIEMPNEDYQDMVWADKHCGVLDNEIVKIMLKMLASAILLQ